MSFCWVVVFFGCRGGMSCTGRWIFILGCVFVCISASDFLVGVAFRCDFLRW